MTILMCAQKLTDASLIYRTVPKTKTSKMKKLKKLMDMLRRNGAGQENIESVWKREGSLGWTTCPYSIPKQLQTIHAYKLTSWAAIYAVVQEGFPGHAGFLTFALATVGRAASGQLLGPSGRVSPRQARSSARPLSLIHI